VALIRTDVSEDRIASIFRVYECEQVTELTVLLRVCAYTRAYSSPTSLCLYKSLQFSYESVPIQELTAVLSNVFIYWGASD
jgi:hypothetical protein